MSMIGPQALNLNPEEKQLFQDVSSKLLRKEITPRNLPQLLGSRELFDKFKLYYKDVQSARNELASNQKQIIFSQQQVAQSQARLNQIDKQIVENRETLINTALKASPM